MSIPITVLRLPIQRTAQIRGWGRFVWYAILVTLAVTLAVTLLVTTGTSAWADLETAREAARRGDHATAFRELLPLADAGDVDAQYYLGGLYYKGEGVEQDYAKAVKWFGESADQGNAKAQTDLAQCYLFGYGVERDSTCSGCGQLVSAGCRPRLCARDTQPRDADVPRHGRRAGPRAGSQVGDDSDVQVRR